MLEQISHLSFYAYFILWSELICIFRITVTTVHTCDGGCYRPKRVDRLKAHPLNDGTEKLKLYPKNPNTRK